MSQQEIIRRRKIILSYYQDIVHYLGKFGLEKEDLADAINETFITAFEKAGSVRNEEAIKVWLIKIAKHTGLRFKKKYKKEAPITFIESITDRLDDEIWQQDVADDMIREADGELLNKCLAQLNEKEYRVITLQYKYNEKLKDIALITGENINNVKSISKRAKDKLKRLLIEGGYTHGK
ncbi:MAG: sigma-70 family RNA polymerase sigma factor [Firmicutes bacterium]|nr:sigma-70 family RNA polymerase sigma factor [Bacillota bacterium]